MAQNVIQILIEARNNASAGLAAARAEVTRTKVAMAQATAEAAKARAALAAIGTAAGPALVAARAEVNRTTAALAQARAAAAGAKSALAEVAPAAGGFGSAAIAIAGVTAAFGIAITAVRGLVDSLKELGAGAEQIQNFSEKTGASVENLQTFQQAFKDAGVPVETLNVGLRLLAKEINDNNPLLAELGIKTKRVDEAFLQLSDIMARSADGTRKQGVAFALLGQRTGSELIPVMNKGSAAILSVGEAARAMGLQLSSGAVRQLAELDDQFGELEKQVGGLRTQLALLAAPGISNVVQHLSDAIGQINRIRDGFKEAQKAMADFINTTPGLKQLAILGTVASAIDKATDELDRLRGSSKGAAAAGPQEPDGPPIPGGLELPDIEELKRRADLAAKAAEQLKNQLKQVNDELRKAALSDKDIERLAQAFARGAITAEDLLKQFHDVATTVKVIQAAEPFQRIDATAQKLGETLKAPVAQARALADELLRASEVELDRRGQPPWLLDLPVDEKVPETKPVGFDTFQVRQELEAWRAAVREVFNDVGAATAVLRGIFSGFESGLQQVFHGLIGSAQTMGSAIKTIFRSMADEILAQLARISAAKVVGFFLGLFSKGGKASSRAGGSHFIGPPAPHASGGVIEGPGSDTSDNIPAMLSPGEFVVRASAVRRPGVLPLLEGINRGALAPLRAAMGAMVPRAPSLTGFARPGAAAAGDGPAGAFNTRQPMVPERRGDTFHIHGYDTHTVVKDLMSPGGSLRRALERVAVHSSY